MATTETMEFSNSEASAASKLDAVHGGDLLSTVATALGLDLLAANELERADANFLQEMASLAPELAGMPSGTDVPAMRNWVAKVFESETLKGEQSRFRASHYPSAEINKEVIKVPCSGKIDQAFELWIYNSQNKAEGESQSLKPTILMFHGGGWIHGSPVGDEPIAQYFASELNAVVIGVDYRLAPEHRFPAPLDDCKTALDWVCHNAEKCRIDTTRIGIWGASAGGNLAAALALQSKSSNIKLVSLVVPITAHPKAWNHFQEACSFPKSRGENLFGEAAPIPEAVVAEFEKLLEFYTGHATEPCDPYISPLMSKPTSTHPSTKITVAACDALRSQGQAYAELLRRAGVKVEEDILPGVPHGFTFALNAIVTTAWLKREKDAFAAAFNVT